MNKLMMIRKPFINQSANWNNLGYVLKDGTINFASRDTLLEYAKNTVQKGLHAENPYEVYVAWKDNRILGVTKGTRRCVHKPKNLPEGSSGMHGHIREVPISPMDYLKMMVDNSQEEIALCPSGRYSRIVKLNGENNNLKTTQRKIVKTYKALKTNNQISNFMHICKLVPLLIKIFGKKLLGIKLNIKDYNKLNELDKKLAIDSSKQVQNIFEKLGPESGVKYESNLLCR